MSIEHYQRLIDVLPEATLIIDNRGRLLAVNKAAAHAFGCTRTHNPEFLQDVLRPPVESALAYLRQCARSREPLVGALELKCSASGYIAKGALLEPRQGRQEPVILLRLFPKAEATAQFKALKERISRLNDEIAKRQRAEYDFRTQSHWLEVTLKSIGDAVITTDRNGRVTFLNPIAETMTGWSSADAAGKNLNQVFVVVNEYTRAPVENPADKALREARVVALANHSVLISSNGVETSIEDTAAPIVLDGDIVGAVLVFHDVSDRRQLERQLVERAERMALSNRRKNEFLTMLAHELRSPLAPISNAIEIMRMQPDAPASLERPRAIVSRQVQHLKRLVDDMLDVSRITRGKMNVERHRVDFGAIIREGCGDLKPQFTEAGIAFDATIPATPVWVEADADRLTQVLHNLLVNAIKFTPAGGAVAVYVRNEAGDAVLEVADSGIGIDSSVMPDLFEPFTQASQTLDRSTGGLGLGLSLAKGIIDLHDGEIKAISEGRDKGTTVQVRLPLADGVEDSVKVARRGAAPAVHDILLIEDEQDAAATMSELLRLLGHRVVVANTGPAGLKMATAMMPTMIICDIGLPGLDGFALAERLRENPLTADIPMIALTGYGDAEFVERAREAGFNHHITKPANIEDIQAAMAVHSSTPQGR